MRFPRILYPLNRMVLKQLSPLNRDKKTARASRTDVRPPGAV